MPVISTFFGIIIRMFNNGEHNPPHFHAEYQDYHAVFYLDGRLKEGKMPRAKRKLIVAWAEIHKDDLQAAWKLAINEEPLFKIDPLH